MSKNPAQDDTRFESLKDESARQRWQLFHRAIAQAKRSNTEAMQEAEGSQQGSQPGPQQPDGESQDAGPDPQLSIAR